MPAPDTVSTVSTGLAHGPPEAPDPGARTARMLLGVGVLAFLLRLLHTQALLADPLFYVTLGGNAPYLAMAEEIVSGKLLPDGAFTLNSPIYPYLVALVYELAGSDSLFAVRATGALFDAGACALVALLAARHFGAVAGWAAGIVYAVYGPAIFFASELAPVSLGLFLVLLALVLLDGRGTPLRFAAAGLVLGLATGARPNFLLCGVLALLVPWTRGLDGRRRLAFATLAGLVVGLAPVAGINWAASGRFTLLTLSGGHNLYIGHNPDARAQYTLPAALDGDIFQTMKALAEEAEGRPFEPHEVSAYYTRKAISSAISDPGREVKLAAARALLLVNDFEASTYANPYYQRTYSTLLRVTPTFAWLFALALPGMVAAKSRRRWHLWIPLVCGVASVVLFFYIARLRVIVVPTLAIFAGVSLARILEAIRTRRLSNGGRRRLAVGVTAALVGFGVAKLPVLTPDTSNEWNKAGGVLRVMGRHQAAAAALERARVANPANPNTYFNLAVLYRETGRPAEADEAETRGRELAAASGGGRDAYLETLRER